MGVEVKEGNQLEPMLWAEGNESLVRHCSPSPVPAPKCKRRTGNTVTDQQCTGNLHSFELAVR
jgi:hypothetical protein